MHAFQSFAASRWNGFTLTGAGERRYLQALRVNAGYWKTLDIPPTLGRYFTAGEDVPGAPPVVVISHGLWQASFGADPTIVGRSITLRGAPYTVVGVARPLRESIVGPVRVLLLILFGAVALVLAQGDRTSSKSWLDQRREDVVYLARRQPRLTLTPPLQHDQKRRRHEVSDEVVLTCAFLLSSRNRP